MKRILPILILCINVFLVGCGSGSNQNTKCPVCGSAANGTIRDSALNVTIFLDLSNRVVRNGLVPSQKDRDITLVDSIASKFVQKTICPHLLESKNSIKVLFYPSPEDSSINQKAASLQVDLSKYPKDRSRIIALENLKDSYKKNLSDIYEKTIHSANWVGCDIWSFFSLRNVDNLCVREGNRNILFIITDGYIDFVDNRIKIASGEKYKSSYVWPNMLSDKSFDGLIVKRENVPLYNLEVCILEVNPFDPKTTLRLQSVLEEWLVGMGIPPEKITIAKTDLPLNTQPIIDKIFE